MNKIRFLKFERNGLQICACAHPKRILIMFMYICKAIISLSICSSFLWAADVIITFFQAIYGNLKWLIFSFVRKVNDFCLDHIKTRCYLKYSEKVYEKTYIVTWYDDKNFTYQLTHSDQSSLSIPLENINNQTFSDVFSWYKKGTLARNGSALWDTKSELNPLVPDVH